MMMRPFFAFGGGVGMIELKSNPIRANPVILKRCLGWVIAFVWM